MAPIAVKGMAPAVLTQLIKAPAAKTLQSALAPHMKISLAVSISALSDNTQWICLHLVDTQNLWSA